MMKKERIYRELLWLAERDRWTTQRTLAKTCGVSLNLVNSVTRELKRVGALEAYPMRLHITDPAKILYAWASQRNLEQDITSRYAIGLPVHEIEKNMSGDVVFTAFSGWRLRAKGAPFDYNKVYAYVSPAAQTLVKRLLELLPRTRGDANTFVMAVDDPHLFMRAEHQVASVAQLFVDIYAMPSTPTTDGFLRDIIEKNEHLRL